jgi:hypothetical protein
MQTLDRHELFLLLYEVCRVARIRLNTGLSEEQTLEKVKNVLIEKIPHLVEVNLIELAAPAVVNMVKHFDGPHLYFAHQEKVWSLYRVFRVDPKPTYHQPPRMTFNVQQ